MKPDASFYFRDASGRVEFRKDRFNGRKRARKEGRDEGPPFVWSHRIDGGDWCEGRGDHRPFLYRRAEIDEWRRSFPDAAICYVEGEAKADRLWQAGLPATCPLDGASSSLRDEDTAFLTGAPVVTIPDMDHSGLRHMRIAVDHLRTKAACVVELILPGGLRHREDLVEWFDKYGHGPEELKSLAFPLLRDALGPSSPVVLALKDFLSEHSDPTPSLVGDGVIARESLNVLAGDPGTGKTALALNLALSLAAGGEFLGLPVSEPSGCLFVEAEGNRDRFRQRVSTARESLGFTDRDMPVFFAPRLAAFEIGESLEAMIRECRPGLVVLDTIGLFHDGEENSATDWKKFVVKPLRRMAEATGAAFLLLHHFGKPAEGRSGGHRVRGTSAIRGDVDSLLLLEAAKSGENLRVLTFDKLKNGPPVDPIVIRFDRERALFERTSDDAVTALKPRLAEVQRIVLERGEIKTAELKAAIMDELELGRTQAEGLIASAHAAGLIERRKRGIYGPAGTLLVSPPTSPCDIPF